MDKPLLLDLFSGAGGAARGYADAGFEVVGVDMVAQPRYPYVFRQGDALACFDALLAGREWGGYVLSDFAAIHASPPCQGYSSSKGLARTALASWQPLLAPMRERLTDWGGVWAMENVAGSHRDMRWPLRLCGTQFGLLVYRHRLFETSHPIFSPGECRHPRYLAEGYLCVYGNQARRRQTGNTRNKYQRATVAEARAAMGIEWMTQKELSQSIPPAYTEWIGSQLMAVIQAHRPAA